MTIRPVYFSEQVPNNNALLPDRGKLFFTVDYKQLPSLPLGIRMELYGRPFKIRRHTHRTLVAIIQLLSLCRHRFRGIIRGYHPWTRKLRSTRDSNHEGGERPIRPVSVIPLLPSFYFQVKTTKPESKSRSRINKKILLA